VSLLSTQTQQSVTVSDVTSHC